MRSYVYTKLLFISNSKKFFNLSTVDLPNSIMDDEERDCEVRQISINNTSERKRSRLSPLSEQVSTSGVGNDEEFNDELQEQINREEAKKMDLFLNDTSGDLGDFENNGNKGNIFFYIE